MSNATAQTHRSTVTPQAPMRFFPKIAGIQDDIGNKKEKIKPQLNYDQATNVLVEFFLSTMILMRQAWSKSIVTTVTEKQNAATRAEELNEMSKALAVPYRYNQPVLSRLPTDVKLAFDTVWSEEDDDRRQNPLRIASSQFDATFSYVERIRTDTLEKLTRLGLKRDQAETLIKISGELSVRAMRWTRSCITKTGKLGVNRVTAFDRLNIIFGALHQSSLSPERIKNILMAEGFDVILAEGKKFNRENIDKMLTGGLYLVSVLLADEEMPSISLNLD